eukprot:Nk52_evm34s1737 gene=Nk52_evmTU34s1737
MSVLKPSCLFCKIIRGEIPSFKLLENDKVFAFLDIGPLSKGHCLVIPKYCAEQMHQVPDDYLAEILPAVKKLASACGGAHYNVLQNNGTRAHQEVMHVHFHMIPKPEDTSKGLGIHWPTKQADMDELKTLADEIIAKL